MTKDDIRKAIWTCKSGKAPGRDGIIAEVLKEGWSAAENVLVRLYGTCVLYSVPG